jgi:hypothetical protein
MGMITKIELYFGREKSNDPSPPSLPKFNYRGYVSPESGSVFVLKDNFM